MKIFAVRDEEGQEEKDLAYLIYYEKSKSFYIELPEDADPWETPLILSSFVERGEKTVNSYWSRLWVQQRIIPSDRQNLGQILKENGLEEYDEFQLLALACGRCAQDSYYLAPITEKALLAIFPERYQIKVEDVVPLKGGRLLVFFRNGEVKKCDMGKLLGEKAEFFPVLNNEEMFRRVGIQPGGYGVSWGEGLAAADEWLYRNSEGVPLFAEDFKSFVQERTATTLEAADILECSRQNMDDLVRRGKLHPVKKDSRSRLFLKSEVERRVWK